MPRYDQITLDLNDRHNKLQQIYHQIQKMRCLDSSRCLVSYWKFDNDFATSYELKTWKRNLCFVLKGISR
jgi:5-formyltetrahydrofolate cyclo-ligase